jgi:hypothetical protein
MDSFTRYARRSTTDTQTPAGAWRFALAFVAFFILAHLDLILWGA